MKAAAILPQMKVNKPLVERTFAALCISVFSINQLNSDSIGSRTEETAEENKSTKALPLCFSCSDCP
jgi:hypothetical protein